MIATMLATQLFTLVGLELVANDPFVKRRGVTVSVEVRPKPWFAISAMGGGYPNLGSADYSPLAKEIIFENQVAPDISRIVSRERLAAHWFPVNTELGALHTNVGLFVGGGAMQTRDDLVVLQVENDPAYFDAERQSHPSFSWGVTAEARKNRVGLRVRFEEARYQEVVKKAREKKVPVWFGADLVILLN